MTDNNVPQQDTVTTDSPSVISMEQIRAMVESELGKYGFMTADQVTALLDKQTLTFQASLTTLRGEFSDQIKAVRGDFTSEMEEWRRIIRGLDDLVRQGLIQNASNLQLAAEIKGQNSEIAKTLDRFDGRLNDFGGDVDAKLKETLTEIKALIHEAATSIRSEYETRITILEKNDQWRTKVEKAVKSGFGTGWSLLKGFWSAVRFVTSPRMLALIIGVGALTGVSVTALVEFLKALGGG